MPKVRLLTHSAELAPTVVKGGIKNWFRNVAARRRARRARLAQIANAKRGKKRGGQLVPAREGARP